MNVSGLTPGMVLAQDVRDVNGRLLMREGDRLAERSIAVLKAWGVEEVSLEGDRSCSLAEAGAHLPEALALLAQDLAAARLAANDLDHPFVQDVFTRMVDSLAARMLAGEDVRPPSAVSCVPPPVDAAPPLSVEELAVSDPAVGAVPEVLARLAQTMEDPSASPAELAAIIQNDPGLAANLLKLVNSAVYGFPQRIETISRAVTIIGVQQLSALALGMKAMGMFTGVPKELLDTRVFWRHSLACACGCRVLASLLGWANTERFFVAGLLHDVGLLLILLHAPGRARLALEAVRLQGEGLVAAERRILGLDHAQAGETLLKRWGLPDSLIQAAARHHDPLRAATSGRDVPGEPSALPDGSPRHDEGQRGPEEGHAPEGTVPSLDPAACPPDADALRQAREAALTHVADFLAEALHGGACGHGMLTPLNMAALALLAPPSGAAGRTARLVGEQLAQLETLFMAHGKA